MEKKEYYVGIINFFNFLPQWWCVICRLVVYEDEECMETRQID